MEQRKLFAWFHVSWTNDGGSPAVGFSACDLDSGEEVASHYGDADDVYAAFREIRQMCRGIGAFDREMMNFVIGTVIAPRDGEGESSPEDGAMFTVVLLEDIERRLKGTALQPAEPSSSNAAYVRRRDIDFVARWCGFKIPQDQIQAAKLCQVLHGMLVQRDCCDRGTGESVELPKNFPVGMGKTKVYAWTQVGTMSPQYFGDPIDSLTPPPITAIHQRALWMKDLRCHVICSGCVNPSDQLERRFGKGVVGSIPDDHRACSRHAKNLKEVAINLAKEFVAKDLAGDRGSFKVICDRAKFQKAALEARKDDEDGGDDPFGGADFFEIESALGTGLFDAASRFGFHRHQQRLEDGTACRVTLMMRCLAHAQSCAQLRDFDNRTKSGANDKFAQRTTEDLISEASSANSEAIRAFLFHRMAENARRKNSLGKGLRGQAQEKFAPRLGWDWLASATQADLDRELGDDELLLCARAVTGDRAAAIIKKLGLSARRRIDAYGSDSDLIESFLHVGVA